MNELRNNIVNKKDSIDIDIGHIINSAKLLLDVCEEIKGFYKQKNF